MPCFAFEREARGSEGRRDLVRYAGPVVADGFEGRWVEVVDDGGELAVDVVLVAQIGERDAEPLVLRNARGW